MSSNLHLTLLCIASICWPGLIAGQTNHAKPSPIAPIGSRHFTWTDLERPDPLYEADAYREVLVQVWYPASAEVDVSQVEKTPYFPFLQEVKAHLSHWEDADFKEAQAIETQSYLDLPIRKQAKKYPLLIFSPALGAHSSYYTWYAEKLAREGYVVMGVNSKYEHEYVINSDKRVTVSNLAYHDSLKTLQIPEQITADAYRLARSQRLKVIGEDLVFAVRQLQQVKNQDFVAMVDWENIGALGHSIGGCAAIDAGRVDSRIKAVVNIDGTPSTDALTHGMEAPFMFIEDLTDYRNHTGYKIQFDRRANFCRKVQADAYRVLIGRTNHSGFYSSTLRFANTEQEKKDALRVLEITYTHLSRFFAQYLKNTPADFGPHQSTDLEVFLYRK